MKTLLPRLGALAATFVLGITTNSVVNRVYPRFENVGIASVRVPPDGRGSSTAFRSREGINLIFDQYAFPSPEAANTAFQRMLKNADTILLREVLYDRERKRTTGERVVITYRTESGVNAAAVISLDDSKVYCIASTSLRHALFFERKHRRY